MCELFKFIDQDLFAALMVNRGVLESDDRVEAFRSGWFAAKHALEPHADSSEKKPQDAKPEGN